MIYGKEYQHGGKTYRLVLPGPDYFRQLDGVQQRNIAHQLNGYIPGGYQCIAETWAIFLGITPKEAAELPLRLFIEIVTDCDTGIKGFREGAAAFASKAKG
jgi:hypothetical protein